MKCKVLRVLSGIIVTFILVLANSCSTTKTPSEPTANLNSSSQSSVSDQEPNELRISEFILGPGDKIEISVYRHDDLKKSIQIDPSGRISYPLVGDIEAAGLSIFQLRDTIRDGLSKYIIDPQVSVGVTAVQSQKITVLGEVRNPGIFSLDIPKSTLDVVAEAGGFTIDAKQKSVLLIRGGLKNPQLLSLNFKKALKEGDLRANISLQNGDIIYVPATYIANVSRYFAHISKIIQPIVLLETGYFLGQQIEGGGGRGTAITAP